MASNKNQHFVPRCYLRPFTLDGADSAIHLYNIDRQKFIEQAPVKHQCSGDYFYGKDSRVESAIQSMESAYGTALSEILKSDYALTDEHRDLLTLFWLLQHLRTVEAFNQHQFLNCRANVFVQDSAHSRFVHESFLRVAPRRPEKRHLIHYAVLDRHEGDFARYRVVNHAEAGDHEEAMIHTQVVHARPTTWPRQISWRPKGFVFTNGTGVGYVRRAWTGRHNSQPFRKEFAHGK